MESTNTMYVINHPVILADRNLPALIRQSVSDVVELSRSGAGGYATVGDWLKDLGLSDLETFAEWIGSGLADEQQQSQMLLLSMVLAEAEGLPPSPTAGYVQGLIVLLSLEMLHRVGVVELDHSSLSMDVDQVDANRQMLDIALSED